MRISFEQIKKLREKGESQSNAIKEQMVAGIPKEEAVKNVLFVKTDAKKPLVKTPAPTTKPTNLEPQKQKFEILDEGDRQEWEDAPQSKTITASASASNGAIVIVIIAVIAIVAGFIYWKSKKSK